MQAAQHYDLGAQPFHPGKGAFRVPGIDGSGSFAGPRYLPRRIFACADFQCLEKGTAGLGFISGRQFLGGSRPQSG